MLCRALRHGEQLASTTDIGGAVFAVGEQPVVADAMQALDMRAEGRGPHAARMVESRCGAVAVGRTYLFPPLSSGGALVVRPRLRFHIPLIEPDRQIIALRFIDVETAKQTGRVAFGEMVTYLNTRGGLATPS
jgi:hypothetical protein